MDKNLKNMLWSKSKPAEEWVGSFLSIPTLDAIELIENYERKKGNAISTPNEFKDCECDACNNRDLSSTSCVNCGHLKQWHKEDKCIGQVFAKPCCECKGYLENTFSALKRNLPLEICDDLFQAIGYVSVMKGHPILKEKMARIDKILTDDLENTLSAPSETKSEPQGKGL